MSMLESWKRLVEEDGGLAEIKIDQYMRSFSGDVISRACFGSNYSKGEEIFLKLRALQEVSSKKLLATGTGMRYYNPNFIHRYTIEYRKKKKKSESPPLHIIMTSSKWCRHLPTKSNREAWALEKEIKKLVLNVVKERDEAGFEKDLLQMVLEGARQSDLSQDAVDRFVVDNCKNIYLAGYETTAVSATWCLMLLASNPQWQERIRHEVAEVCKGHLPDYESARKMKLVYFLFDISVVVVFHY